MNSTTKTMGYNGPTERRLIERAAHACKLPECGWMGPAFMYVKNNRFTDWDPLNDDGDAFRLMLALHLGLAAFDDRAVVFDGRRVDILVHHNGDAAAATRLAIVRAAAAMCEGMGFEK